MALPNYTPERRREIAAALGVDEQYVYQLTKGIKTAKPALARRFHEIDPTARLQDLRPDDWHQIWPELVDQAATAGQG
jgi:predicted regulator of amino acid metabolism with ACT domain